MARKLEIYGKTRLIRNIFTDDGERFEAWYRDHHIYIYPMYGKLVRGIYRDDLKTGEFGVDVSTSGGGKFVDTCEPSIKAGIKLALENILLDEKK